MKMSWTCLIQRNNKELISETADIALMRRIMASLTQEAEDIEVAISPENIQVVVEVSDTISDSSPVIELSPEQYDSEMLYVDCSDPHASLAEELYQKLKSTSVESLIECMFLSHKTAQACWPEALSYSKLNEKLRLILKVSGSSSIIDHLRHRLDERYREYQNSSFLTADIIPFYEDLYREQQLIFCCWCGLRFAFSELNTNTRRYL